MAILKERRGDYGLQRLYGNLGAIFITPISGFLIDYASEESGDQDYRWDAEELQYIFWLSIGFVYMWKVN